MIELILLSVRVIFGFLLILFLPGFAIILILLRKNKFNIPEKIIFSCVLSIAITFLMALLLDIVLGVDTTAINMILSLSLVTIFAFFIWSVQSGNLKKFLKKSKTKHTQKSKTKSKVKK